MSSKSEDPKNRLRESVKELGKLLSELTHGGACSPRIAEALERAREALRDDSKHQE